MQGEFNCKVTMATGPMANQTAYSLSYQPPCSSDFPAFLFCFYPPDPPMDVTLLSRAAVIQQKYNASPKHAQRYIARDHHQ